MRLYQGSDQIQKLLQCICFPHVRSQSYLVSVRKTGKTATVMNPEKKKKINSFILTDALRYSHD